VYRGWSAGWSLLGLDVSRCDDDDLDVSLLTSILRSQGLWAAHARSLSELPVPSSLVALSACNFSLGWIHRAQARGGMHLAVEHRHDLGLEGFGMPLDQDCMVLNWNFGMALHFRVADGHKQGTETDRPGDSNRPRRE
jgi:hypothetical protein